MQPALSLKKRRLQHTAMDVIMSRRGCTAVRQAESTRTTSVASQYSIRLAAEPDVDTLVDFTLREAAEAERVTLSIEEATTGVRGGFGTSPLSTYWVAVAADGSMVASTSVVKEWSNFHGGYYWWIQSLYILPDHRGSGLPSTCTEPGDDDGAGGARRRGSGSNHSGGAAIRQADTGGG
jgi:hypothetical protein